MCCLGVGLDVLEDGEWVLDSSEEFYAFCGGGALPSSAGVLPSYVCANWDISWLDMNRLADFNDAENWSFRKIADWIEVNL